MTTIAARGESTEKTYPMRQWVFDDAAGRYDIDLGDSYVTCGNLADLDVPTDLELDYGHDNGSVRLRELVAQRYQEHATADRVLITHGAQEALYLLYRTLLHPGDRVVAFTPGWLQATDVPTRLGCRVEVVRLADDFSLDLDAVEAAAGPDLRLITINSPSNPTGRRIRADELAAVVALANRTGAYVLLDEEYALVLSESGAAGPMAENGRIISVSGLSKVYGYPGLRTGWMFGPAPVIADCADYRHLTTISTSVLCQALAEQILSRWDDYARRYRRSVDEGLTILNSWAAEHRDAIRLVPPEGTPFAWCWLTTGESSLSFVRRVLDAGVLLMPGETLGTEYGFRLSFAREPHQLIEGLRRVGESFYGADRSVRHRE